MNASKKRKISTRQFLSDMRSGMDDSELKRKYGLSDTALQSIYRKLVAGGSLKEEEIQMRLVSRADSAQSLQSELMAPEWKCPACNATQSAEPLECPVCGVVVSKFVARQAREGQVTAQPPEASPAGRRWILSLSGIVALVLVGVGVLLWPDHSGKEKTKVTAIEPRAETDDRAGKGSLTRNGKLIELQFSGEGFPLGLSVSQGLAFHLWDTPSPGQGFKKLPIETGAKRYYAEFKIAGQNYLVITEESDPPKFYLDANKNGDFTDDPGPFVGEKAEVVPNYYTLQLTYKREESTVPYRMWIFPSPMGGTRFYPACHWHGDLVLGDNTHKLVLFDSNADGDYSNDPVVIDIDHDGKITEAEKLKPGQTRNIDGTVVKLISIAPSGRWVRLK
jgi:hypothetical protein